VFPIGIAENPEMNVPPLPRHGPRRGACESSALDLTQSQVAHSQIILVLDPFLTLVFLA
jgi:hypothetical protein